MTLEGRLTKEKFGYDMPVDAPLYAKPPIYYKRARTLSVTYETDPEAALDILPRGLTLIAPATAVLIFVKYPFSTLGPYEETILCIPCLLNGEMKAYVAHIVVNNDIPQIAGREVWGYPKKMADITFREQYDLIFARMERPAGNLICSAGMRPQTEVSVAPDDIGVLSLRVIPSPEKGAPPSIAELVEIPQKVTVLESWSGPGWAQFHSTSALDPWHKLTVKTVVDVSYRISDMVLDYGRIVKTY